MARVLVIDDEVDVRRLLAAGLGADGHTVLEAADGDEGVAVLGRQAVDLVITDIVMPNKEGFETIIELRKTHPWLKIIAISGGGIMSGTDTLRVARSLGAHATLHKPFRVGDLRRTVAACLAVEAG